MTKHIVAATPNLLAGAISLWATIGMVAFVAL